MENTAEVANLSGIPHPFSFRSCNQSVIQPLQAHPLPLHWSHAFMTQLTESLHTLFPPPNRNPSESNTRPPHRHRLTALALLRRSVHRTLIPSDEFAPLSVITTRSVIVLSQSLAFACPLLSVLYQPNFPLFLLVASKSLVQFGWVWRFLGSQKR
jgi:hypothetical protein